jgi:hypothetical protein
LDEQPDPITLTRRVASYGLAGRPAVRFDVPDPSTGPFVSALLAQRLTGLAAAAWQAGHLGLSRPGALLDRQREVMFSVLRIERVLLRLAAVFEDAGIEVVVLKGPAVARTLYPDPSWRPFGDIDLLVRTRDWARVCDVLERLGHRRVVPEPRRGFDVRFGKGAEYLDEEERIEVDLHRTLVVGPFGLWLDPDELFLRADTFLLGGRRLRRLDDTALLLHACLHAVLGPRPVLLMPLRDVAQALGSAHVRWPTLRDWAARWNLGPVLAEAFTSVEEILGFSVPTEARSLSRMASPRRARRALVSSVGHGEGGAAVATLRAIPGVRAKAAYVWGLLVPDRAFLASRSAGRGRPSYLRRWLKPIRWLGNGGQRS